MKQSRLSLLVFLFILTLNQDFFAQCNQEFGIINENLTYGVVKHSEQILSVNTKDFYIYDDGTYTDYRNPRHRYLGSSGSTVAYKIKGYSNDPKKKKTQPSTPPSGGYFEDNFPVFSGPAFIATSWKHAVVPVNDPTNNTCNAPYYAVIVQNCTNSTGSGRVEFYYKSNQAFVSSAEPIRFSYANNQNWFTNLQQTDVTNQGPYNKKISLNFSGLLKGERRAFYVPLAHNNLSLHQTVDSKVKVILNNVENPCALQVHDGIGVDLFHSTTVMAFPHDPNYIDVIPGCLDIKKRLETRKVIYKINFQNIGSGPATNIKIVDFLSKYVSLNTVQVIDSKHSVTSTTTNQSLNGNQFIINFDGISLPGLAQPGINVEKTKGWVRIGACLKPGLDPSIVNLDNPYCIDNYAAIYFDTQPAVYTAMATVCEDFICQNTPAEIAELNLFYCGAALPRSKNINNTLYPNPFSAELTIESDLLRSGCNINITNLQGQTVYSNFVFDDLNTTFRIDTNDFNNGMYIVQLTAGTEVTSFKVIKN